MADSSVAPVSVGPQRKTVREAAVGLYNWYVSHLKKSRRLFQTSEVVVLIAAAAVPVSGLIAPDKVVPSVIGGVVTVLTGLRSVFHWRENWIRFAGAASVLRADLRLYDAQLAPYDDPATRDGLLMAKVNAVEGQETASWSELSAPEKPKQT